MKRSNTYFYHNMLRFFVRLYETNYVIYSLSSVWYKCNVAKVCSGMYVCMYVCYQLFSKTTGLNCMKFSGMICHHPRTNRLDFGSDQVKGQGQGQGHEKVSKATLPNCMKFSGMICHHPRTNRLDFGSNQVKGSRSRSRKGKKHIFCHNALNFCPIHMKRKPKCSLFNSLSSDTMNKNVTLAEDICSTECPF